MSIEKIEFEGKSVTIDPSNLKFDENSLTNYIQKESGYYDNFGAFLALAEKHLQKKDLIHEKVFHERFAEAKDNGGSDKLAEAKAKSDDVVIALKQEIIEAKYIVQRLRRHLMAWDKNHDNAQSLGHMLRKQMDKLNGDIMMPSGSYRDAQEIAGLDKAIEDMCPSVDSDCGSLKFETNLSSDNLY